VEHRFPLLPGLSVGLSIQRKNTIGLIPSLGFVMKTFSIQDDDSRLLRETRKWSFWFLIMAIINVVTSFVVGFFLSSGGDRIDRRLRLRSLIALLKQVRTAYRVHIAMNAC
jgi:hypothetical protein